MKTEDKNNIKIQTASLIVLLITLLAMIGIMVLTSNEMIYLFIITIMSGMVIISSSLIYTIIKNRFKW